MEFLYIASSESMAELARRVGDIAFAGFDIEERYGLNIGEGQYFKIHRGGDVAIVCSADYGDPPEPQFNYLLYLSPGNSGQLAQVADLLKSSGWEVRIDV